MGVFKNRSCSNYGSLSQQEEWEKWYEATTPDISIGLMPVEWSSKFQWLHGECHFGTPGVSVVGKGQPCHPERCQTLFWDTISLASVEVCAAAPIQVFASHQKKSNSNSCHGMKHETNVCKYIVVLGWWGFMTYPMLMPIDFCCTVRLQAWNIIEASACTSAWHPFSW